jgi:hypothetical protein
MDYIVFARWFGIVSLILSIGILFNLEDAKEMATNMIKHETGYIMGGVLPVIFGTYALLYFNGQELNWSLVIYIVGVFMVVIGIFRCFFVNKWKTLLAKHVEKIPFLFSLFGLMLAIILLYIGFIEQHFKLFL